MLKKIDNIISLIEKRKIFAVIISFLLLYLLIFIKLDVKLLFSDTIITGGDTASWYQSAKSLKEIFIPNGRLFGWTMANFFGYNELQYYFTIPFLISVILSLVMPLTVALKITTLAGILSLPIAFYYTANKFTKNLWISLSASFLSLIFLFNESYTMYGGNFLSTFAGEFAYSISLSIFVFFLGVCFETFQKGKSPIIPGILLGLIGLSHLFVYMVAFFVPFFFIFANKIKNSVAPPKKISKQKTGDAVDIEFSSDKISEKIVLIYIINFVIMAFWLIPLIFTREFSQSISMIWRFADIKDFFRQTFFGLFFLGVALNIFLLINSKKDRIISFLFFYLFLVTIFFYIISTFLQIPDIRFVPPALIIALFSITIFLNFFPEYFFNKNYPIVRPILYLIIVVSSFILVNKLPKNVVSWYNWNYSGYEAKKEWPNLKKIIEQYKGDINTGRILWEKQNQNDNADFGSERAFENLYLFTGRPSTEGVHYGSSFMARATTYMQSEYSLNPVDPESHRLYSVVNPKVWPVRFYQTNSKDIIVYSKEIKQKFDNHTNFEKTGEFGKFSIYTFKYHPKSYIRIVDNENLSVVKSNKYGFKTDFYRAFRDYELFDYPFITGKYAKGLKTANYFNNYDEYRNKFFDPDFDFNSWLENYKYKTSISEENVQNFKIQFKTKEIGKPHIINITYSPNFKAKNGDKIYPVSPGFMMIIPSEEDVVINYGRNIYEIIGLIVTLLIIPIIIFRKKIEAVTIPRVEIVNRIAITLVALIAIVLLFETLTEARKIPLDQKRAETLFYKEQNYQKALDIANKYATVDMLDKYDNAQIYSFYMMKARILLNQNKKEEAKRIYDYITNRYNHTRNNDYNRLNFK
ncbi:MAG TPA: hypothetical protein PK385_01740 [Spirochaetota bacterium]|nr:hypothetical protein [Spirochaetota bacterium]HOS31572.1 hypothetical protein [Spirochaetota bacterium]HOS54759.1 hypothetical protein [Spirochaetota bacterium]HPK62259.1 hypothetical protein [Spirochaetota bacterium]HQF77439.1 hypothetical protein [Spirochaetota bacterium]